MANGLLEHEGFVISAVKNGDGTYSPDTHLLGGSGVAFQGLEIQGYRMQLFSNGDGTFAICTTTSTGATDKTVEFEGFRLKIHPTGNNDPVTGAPMYAFVINAV